MDKDPVCMQGSDAKWKFYPDLQVHLNTRLYKSSITSPIPRNTVIVIIYLTFSAGPNLQRGIQKKL